MVDARFVALAGLLLLAACDSDAVKYAKDSIRHSAFDPDAVQFREVAECDHDKTVVRGEFNGKNRFGAYTGFEPFFYGNYHSVTSADIDGFYDMMWRCYDKATLSPEVRKTMEEGEAMVRKRAALSRQN